MSSLRSVVDELRAETLAELPDALVEEDFAELQRACEQLEVERLRRLAELDRRRLFERDGYQSTASWLVSTCRLGWGAAREQVRLARALDQMPKTRDAVERGEVSLAGARVLAFARDVDPEAFASVEDSLVEAARIHSIADLGRVAAYWRHAVEAGDAGEGALRGRRRLHASISLEGMVRVDGDLDPETGETLLTALGAVMDAEARSGAEDGRTPAQRRADALGEVCRQWLDRSDRPSVAGERPHLTVTVADQVLTAGRISELDRTGPVDPGGGAAYRLRRLGDARGAVRALRAARRRSHDRRGPTVDASCRRRAGSTLPVPGLRSPARLVRRASHPTLG